MTWCIMNDDSHNIIMILSLWYGDNWLESSSLWWLFDDANMMKTHLSSIFGISPFVFLATNLWNQISVLLWSHMIWVLWVDRLMRPRAVLDLAKLTGTRSIWVLGVSEIWELDVKWVLYVKSECRSECTYVDASEIWVLDASEIIISKLTGIMSMCKPHCHNVVADRQWTFALSETRSGS